MPDFSVQGKTVVITGGLGGNGSAIANAFEEHGAKVIVLDIKEPDMKVSGDLKTKKIIPVDLSNIEDIKNACHEIKTQTEVIHCLINCAGVTYPLSSEDPYGVWQKTIAINLTAPYVLTTELLSLMPENNASIINISSLGAEFGFPDNPSYISSKGGLKQLTKSMAYDYAKRGIRVNCIMPGYILTDMTRSSYNNELSNKSRLDRMLIKRWGMPEDLSGACIFLASDASSYITGISLPVDGGWMTKGL